MKKILFLTSVALLLLLNFERCDDLELDPKKLSSFDLIQQKILNFLCYRRLSPFGKRSFICRTQACIE